MVDCFNVRNTKQKNKVDKTQLTGTWNYHPHTMSV